MAPPGRRRVLSNFPFALILLCIFCSTASAASAVLGIDIGTEYLKAALVKPGIPLEIVLSKDSKRKETAAVAFKPAHNAQKGSFPERLYGSDAAALAARFPADVYPNLKSLLGISVDGSTEILADYRAAYPALQLAAEPSRGTVAFTSTSYTNDEKPFLVEELLAMEMQNLIGNAEALAGKGTTIKDVVITIPAFYTAQEKRAVGLAADLAGLKVLALVSDGLAVGLNYATSRTFKSLSEGGEPEHHIVLDMGAGSTTATLLKFQGRMVKDVGRFNKTIQEVVVLGTGWDRTLGGDALNRVIVEDMVEKFVASPKAKKAGVTAEAVRSHGRAAAKLWKEAERARQVLSANSETFASFEGLYDEVDFRYKITRAQFEELTTSFAERVEAPLLQAVSAAELDFSKIDSVILHGGASRTPFVQKQLEKIVGGSDKVRTNVNSDEAAVFGAAFQGAGLSPSFRVKEIRSVENAGYAAGVTWKSDGKDRRQRLFTPTSEAGAAKQVPFKTLEDFAFTLFQHVPASASKESTDIPVVNIKTQNLTASVAQLTSKSGCLPADISTNFGIQLSPLNGLPEVIEGTVSCEVDVAEKKGVVDDVKDFFGFGSKKGDQDPLKDTDEAGDPSSTSEKSESATTTSSTAESSSSSTAEAESKPKEIKKRTDTIKIKFSVKTEGLAELSATDLKRIKKRLADFDASDTARKQREEALNTLEAFTYRSRDLLTDDAFAIASTEAERTSLEEKLHDTNEWLYGAGADADRDTLKARLADLKGIVNPVQKRITEAEKRPGAVDALRSSLSQTQMLVKSIKEQLEAAEKQASSESIASENTQPQTTVQPSSVEDDFADLDDEPSTSTSTTTTSSTPAPGSFKPVYSPEDLEKISSASESVGEWLAVNMGEQNKLSPSEDPVILSKDIEAKSKQLQEALMELLQKSMRTPPKSKSSSSKKSKSKKTKSKSSRTSKGKGTSTASTTAAESESPSGTAKKSYIHMGDGENRPSDDDVDAGLKKVREMEQRIKDLRDGKIKLDDDPEHNEL
ncbi:MAG: hypothetical protein M4579_004539 [Chaenotheca gracillima]|nr:MAG: hypothetical protein M4579_004539 [Chaenotheca gracillima]